MGGRSEGVGCAIKTGKETSKGGGSGRFDIWGEEGEEREREREEKKHREKRGIKIL